MSNTSNVCVLGNAALEVCNLNQAVTAWKKLNSVLCRARRNTLVCDGVAEAKRLAFMGPERHKVTYYFTLSEAPIMMHQPYLQPWH